MTPSSDSDFGPLDLVAEVEALLAADPSPAPAPRYGPLHEAAAVLAVFDPETLRPMPDAGAPEPVDELLADSDLVGTPDTGFSWSLRTGVRVGALRRLRETGRVRLALDANPRRPASDVQRALDAYLTGRARPVARQSLPQVAASHAACDWLRAAGFPDLPDDDAVTARLDWLTLLRPFEHIAGDFFRGRTNELARLRAFAGVLPPRSARESAQRLAERLKPARPLHVYGPGGVGKSALVSRFILEHARAHEADRFPFAYLDFDRPDVVESEPLTLLIEATRQLGIEYPHVRAECENLRRDWKQRLGSGRSGVAWTRSAGVRDFASMLESLGARDRPVLFVLDTFEEVQWSSTEYVSAVLDLLDQLRVAVPRLRACVVGRAPLRGKWVGELALTGLDEQAALGYLAKKGVSDPGIAAEIVRRVGGSPLSLAMAADLVKRHGDSGRDLADRTFRELLQLRLDDGLVQRQLYRRILRHVHDPDVRKLAHPGLVLRRITPEIILEVLAEPCELGIRTPAEAERLFGELRREVSLVSITADGALEHRTDLRRLMLDLLTNEEPDRTKAIRRSAVAYYERRPPEPAERAEEIYHRLALHHEPNVIDERWLPGVELYLRSALPEFTGGRRAYLASRLGIEVDDETRRRAGIEDWERITARKATELLAEQHPEEAVRLMTERPEWTPCSPLYPLHAAALARLERWGESMTVLDTAIRRAVDGGNRRRALDLGLQLAETALVAEPAADVAGLLSRLAGLAEGYLPAMVRAGALAHQIALAEIASPVPAGDIDRLRGELREVLDGTPDDVVARNPVAARWAGSALTPDDVARLSRVLALTGVPRGDQRAVRRLGASLATYDSARSAEAGEPEGVLARSYGVDEGDSLTGRWTQFLLTADDSTVREVACALLDERGADPPRTLVEAFTDLLRASVTMPREAPETGKAPDRVRHLREPRRAGRAELTAALTGLLATQERAREFLRVRLDRSIDAIAPNSADLHELMLRIVETASREGWLRELVLSALDAFPGDPAVAEVAHAMDLSTLVPGGPEGLTRLHERFPRLDTRSLTERIGRVESQICQVELGGSVVGNGFLVGVDLVLLPGHVVPAEQEKGTKLRFDVRRDDGGHAVTAGTAFKVDRAIVRDRRLDYALLVVHGSPGAQPIGTDWAGPSATQRRWIDVPLPPPVLRPGDALTMAEKVDRHPARLLFQPDAVVAVSADGTRIHHSLSSRPGSSGSPCFTGEFHLAAMHVAADRRGGIAVPLWVIHRDLEERGLASLLGTILP